MTAGSFEQIKVILIERFAIKPAQILPSADLQKELNLDSMDAIDLLLAINETFSIRVPEQMLENIHTVGELAAVVDKHRPSRS